MTACVFCGGAIPRVLSLGFIFSFRPVRDPLICSKCFDQFEEITLENACPGCSRKQETPDLCADCEKWKEKYQNMLPNHTALYTYNDMAHDYMQQFKFQGDILLAQIFRKQLAKALSLYKKTHYIVPIPASTESLQTRGFNQVELLLKKSDISYKNLLIHKQAHKKQSSKSRFERLKTKQPFILAEDTEMMRSLKKPLLIVDDVYTTGRTIFHARKLLEPFTPTASFSLFR